MEDKILTGPLKSIPVKKEREAPATDAVNPVARIIAERAIHCLTSWANRSGIDPETTENQNFLRLKGMVDNLKKVSSEGGGQ